MVNLRLKDPYLVITRFCELYVGCRFEIQQPCQLAEQRCLNKLLFFHKQVYWSHLNVLLR